MFVLGKVDKGQVVPIATSRGQPASGWHDRGSDGVRPCKIVQIEQGRSATQFGGGALAIHVAERSGTYSVKWSSRINSHIVPKEL